MRVDIENKINLDQYEIFLKKIPNVTFFHSKNHLCFLRDLLGLEINFITSRENGELKGILPFFVKESVHGKVVNSLPFFGSYGSVISDNTEVKKQLLEQLNIFNKENDVLSSVIITNPFDSDNQIYENFYRFNSIDKRITQCTVLNENSKEFLWDSLEKRVRWAVKKGEKYLSYLRCEYTDDHLLNEFYNIYKSNMESKKANLKPPQFFKRLRDNFIQGRDYDILVASMNEEPVAYLLSFYFHPFTEYYMPAYKDNWRHLQGTSMLIWKSMLISMEKKMSFYNFGGTSKDQKELYLFKRGWHAKDFSYSYYIYRDLDRLKTIGVEEIKKHYNFFYVSPYQDINYDII